MEERKFKTMSVTKQLLNMFKLPCEESETGERARFTSRVYTLKTD